MKTIIEFQLWSLEIPPHWSVEESEECISFFSEAGFGAVQVSAAFKEHGVVTDDDILDFAKEEDNAEFVMPIEGGQHDGFYIGYCDEDVYWMKWWLRKGQTLLFMTYNCDVADKMKEASVVNEILRTIKIKA